MRLLLLRCFLVLAVGVFACGGARGDLIISSTAASPGLLDTSTGPAAVMFTLSIETTTIPPGHLLESLTIEFDPIPSLSLGTDYTFAAASGADVPFGSSFGFLGSGIFIDFDPGNTAGTGFSVSSTDGMVAIADITLTLATGIVGTFDLGVNAGSVYRIDDGAPGPQTLTTIPFATGPLAGTTFIAAVPEPSAFLFGSVVFGLVGVTSLRKRNRTEVVEG